MKLHARQDAGDGIMKVTWEKLHKNFLQELNQQTTGLLFIFSQLAPLYDVLHLCIYLRGNKG